MGWIIFGVWVVLAIVANLFFALEKNAEAEKEKNHAKIGLSIVMWTGIGLLSIGALFAVGWIWYYICGGYLLQCEDSFFWKAIWGLATLVPLGFVIGFIAICFGWDPRK